MAHKAHGGPEALLVPLVANFEATDNDAAADDPNRVPDAVRERRRVLGLEFLGGLKTDFGG